MFDHSSKHLFDGTSRRHTPWTCRLLHQRFLQRGKGKASNQEEENITQHVAVVIASRVVVVVMEVFPRRRMRLNGDYIFGVGVTNRCQSATHIHNMLLFCVYIIDCVQRHFYTRWISIRIPASDDNHTA